MYISVFIDYLHSLGGYRMYCSNSRERVYTIILRYRGTQKLIRFARCHILMHVIRDFKIFDQEPLIQYITLLNDGGNDWPPIARTWGLGLGP